MSWIVAHCEPEYWREKNNYLLSKSTSKFGLLWLSVFKQCVFRNLYKNDENCLNKPSDIC